MTSRPILYTLQCINVISREVGAFVDIKIFSEINYH